MHLLYKIYFYFLKKKKFLKNIISFFVCLIIFNCLINFEKSKKQYIENFDLKKKFYSEISNLSFNKDFELIGFPDLYKETTFFAHEQIESLKVHLNDKSLPNIYKDLKKNKKDTLKIHFDKIHHNKIIFTIGDIN